MPNKSKYLFIAVSIAGILFNGCGENSSSNATSTPTTSAVDKQETNTTTTSQDTKSSSANDNFGPDNLVPDSYLKDFLSFMNGYYKKIHDIYHAGGNIDQATWTDLLHTDNEEGWNRANKITFQENPDKEKPAQANKRTDVATAWTFLANLSSDYDLSLKGDTTKDIANEEQQYEELYNKAMNDLTQK